jgi:hypothetical protein
MIAHSQVQSLVNLARTWGQVPLKRHNDAAHAIYAFSTLADFGLHADEVPVTNLLQHQSPEGAFETAVSIPKRFGGSGEDEWTWILCDAPTVLYSLLAMGLGSEPQVQRAVEHLAGTVKDNGWPCQASPTLGRFRGPGRATDPCPMANVYVLKALAQVPSMVDGPASRAGIEMLLHHWECRQERKLYLFGIGTDFRKLKYPFVWYNLLHVVDVLSQFPSVFSDPRFEEMVEALVNQADASGRYTAASMYRAWKGWSFADKKNPSAWLTFLVYRILDRIDSEITVGQCLQGSQPAALR